MSDSILMQWLRDNNGSISACSLSWCDSFTLQCGDPQDRREFRFYVDRHAAAMIRHVDHYTIELHNAIKKLTPDWQPTR